MKKNKFLKDNIKLIISDFDGIFTDCKLTVFSDGKTAKQIDYKDIMGISIILKRNIKFAVLSGEKSAAIDILKDKFPSIETFQNERNKLQVLTKLLKMYNIKPEQTIYIGDDINDIECLEYVGYPITVPNAHQKVKEIPNIHITVNNGGNGAFREIADYIL